MDVRVFGVPVDSAKGNGSWENLIEELVGKISDLGVAGGNIEGQYYPVMSPPAFPPLVVFKRAKVVFDVLNFLAQSQFFGGGRCALRLNGLDGFARGIGPVFVLTLGQEFRCGPGPDRVNVSLVGAPMLLFIAKSLTAEGLLQSLSCRRFTGLRALIGKQPSFTAPLIFAPCTGSSLRVEGRHAGYVRRMRDTIAA